MKQRIIIFLMAMISIFFCACKKECSCECNCETGCVCGESKNVSGAENSNESNLEEYGSDETKKELTQEELAEYVDGKEYIGELRQERAIIAAISEDRTTMKVYYSGGYWNIDYVEGMKENVVDSIEAIVADNGTADDLTDDIFMGFILEE